MNDHQAHCEVAGCAWEGPARPTASDARHDEIRHLVTGHPNLDTPITESRFGRLVVRRDVMSAMSFTLPDGDSRKA